MTWCCIGGKPNIRTVDIRPISSGYPAKIWLSGENPYFGSISAIRIRVSAMGFLSLPILPPLTILSLLPPLPSPSSPSPASEPGWRISAGYPPDIRDVADV